MLASRLLSGLSPCLQESKRYPVQVAWVFALMLVGVMQWWVFWRTSRVLWTPTRFLYALSVPAVLFYRAGILLGDAPHEVLSFRDHFYDSRVRFFVLGVVASVQIGLTPWVFGIIPWLSVAPIHSSTAILAVLSLAGLVFKTHGAHTVIVVLTLLLAIAGFYVIPALPPPA